MLHSFSTSFVLHLITLHPIHIKSLWLHNPRHATIRKFTFQRFYLRGELCGKLRELNEGNSPWFLRQGAFHRIFIVLSAIFCHCNIVLLLYLGRWTRSPSDRNGLWPIDLSERIILFQMEPGFSCHRDLRSPSPLVDVLSIFSYSFAYTFFPPIWSFVT